MRLLFSELNAKTTTVRKKLRDHEDMNKTLPNIKWLHKVHRGNKEATIQCAGSAKMSHETSAKQILLAKPISGHLYGNVWELINLLPKQFRVAPPSSLQEIYHVWVAHKTDISRHCSTAEEFLKR